MHMSNLIPYCIQYVVYICGLLEVWFVLLTLFYGIVYISCNIKSSLLHTNWVSFIYSFPIQDGGSDAYFGIENLHPRYFFGSRDLLGLEVCVIE